MRFPGYDPVPDPNDHRELSPFFRRLDQTLNPIALAICFLGGCHIASVWIREVNFSELIFNLKYLPKEMLIAAYKGRRTDPARLKQPKLSQSFVSLSKYSGTRDLKGIKGIGETYVREAYTGFRQLSFNLSSRNDMLNIQFVDDKCYFN